MDDKLLIEAWKRGATSVGRGKKRPHEQERIIFGVPIKKDVPKRKDLNKITSEYTGVVEVGDIKALSNTDRMRPAPPGCSIGHKDITAGTFGCCVHRNGVKFILSNNHVLVGDTGVVGDPILQPAPYDGGSLNDRIALLHDFIPIRFMGEDSTCKYSRVEVGAINARNAMLGRKTRYKAIAHTNLKNSVFNTVDCAIAKPMSNELISEEIMEIGLITGTDEPVLGSFVKKSGRTTSYTEGEIIQTDVTVQVGYGAGRTAIFTDQVMAGSMSAGGDSGSAVLNESNCVVGLLFAGSETTTIINRIGNVFLELNLSL